MGKITIAAFVSTPPDSRAISTGADHGDAKSFAQATSVGMSCILSGPQPPFCGCSSVVPSAQARQRSSLAFKAK